MCYTYIYIYIYNPLHERRELAEDQDAVGLVLLDHLIVVFSLLSFYLLGEPPKWAQDIYIYIYIYIYIDRERERYIERERIHIYIYIYIYILCLHIYIYIYVVFQCP